MHKYVALWQSHNPKTSFFLFSLCPQFPPTQQAAQIQHSSNSFSRFSLASISCNEKAGSSTKDPILHPNFLSY